jgi:D-alanine-D-alanine ligase
MNIITTQSADILAAPLDLIEAHIEIVGSTNPRINAMSEDARLSIQETLKKRYSNVGISIVNNFEDLQALVAKKPELVILGMKLVLLDPSKSYDDSPKVWLSDYLYEHNIAFTGSDTAALTLEFDKQVAKQSVIDAGLKSSRYFVSTLAAPIYDHTLSYPLFVKPTNRGDSKGVDGRSLVHSQQELEAKIRSIHIELSSDALIEEYLPGREFSVAVIKQRDSEALLALPIEITIPVNNQGDKFLSEEIKQADTEQVIAVTDSELEEKLNALAIGVFTALGSRDYGRIDMRIDALDEPSFIEANLMPGLSDHGYLSRCFMLNGEVSYENMIEQITTLGIVRTNVRI